MFGGPRFEQYIFKLYFINKKVISILLYTKVKVKQQGVIRRNRGILKRLCTGVSGTMRI